MSVSIALWLFSSLVLPADQEPPGEDDKSATEEPASEEEKKKRKFELKDKWGGEYVPAVIPTANPTIGSGLTFALLYLRKLDKESRPSTFGVAGFRTDSESWGAGLGMRTRFAADRFRFNGVYAAFNLNYDYFGIGEDAGDRGKTIPLNQRGDLYGIQFLTHLPGNFFLGPQFTKVDVSSTFDLSQLPGFILPPAVEFDTISAGAGLHLQYDSKDREFNPSSGTLFDLEADFWGEYAGGDFDFQQHSLKYTRYLGLGEGDERIIAVRGTFCYTTDDTPFFQLCMLGLGDAFRGYQGGRYRDLSAATVQAEYRWRFWKWLGIVFFGGWGQVAENLSDYNLGDSVPSVGTGLRFLIAKENKLNFRIDYAWGRNDSALYVTIGEAF